MTHRRLGFLRRSLWISSFAIVASLLSTQRPSLAQNISFDGTLGEAATLNGPTYVISPRFGQTVGSNLFHSFRQFNLSTGETALFQSNAGIQNILSRVTGGTPSAIDGLIQTASANVNLYLINPNGILFGPNARLDVGGVGRGAFIATTTDALIWGNDPNRQFSATNPGGRASLLSLVGDPSGFLASQRRPGGISIAGTADPTDLGLAVASEKRLLLLGGDVQLNGGVIRAEGGRVEIGAVSGAGVVGLNLNASGVSLQIPETTSRADIFLDRSYIITNSGDANSGDIALQARNITLRNSTQLQAATFGPGDAGDVLLRASESVSLESGSTIFSTIEAGGRGKGGNILIFTPLLSMSGGSQLQTLVRGGGDGIAGIIYIDTDGGAVNLTDNRTAMFSTLEAGAKNSFSGEDFAGNVFAALLGQTDAEITGSVFVSTGTLNVANGAGLRSDTFGDGNAGAVIVLANEVAITNGGFISSIVGPNATGDGGGIVIGTGNLAISGVDTGLTTSTLGNGDAGLIFVVARDRISSSGSGSGIFSTVTTESSGAGGGIILSARSLVLKNGSEVSVNNEGSGAAGAIFINALAAFLDQDSQISATTRSGQGGDINLNVALLSLYRSSSIATNADTARLASGVQPGGNIRIQGIPRFGFDRTIAITAKPGRDSNIVAKAFKGRGGDINIFAGRLLGIRQRPEVFVTNDIDASSEFGANGFVTVSLLDVDPERGTVPLADNLADASQLIAEGCDTRGRLARGRFTNAGRGGLPPTPDDFLADEDVVAEWVEPNQPLTNNQDGAGGRNPGVQATDDIKNSSEIIEAQGWQISPDGTVVLVAQAPEAPLPIPWLAPSSCRVP
ncbi:MAG: filamentous hemagglutinin N-terminal domain-containing protein [Leptolyngbyaceae cyanobacterium bins.302]|nr:filamentous hemagglutinin N-terminal domain-containing protein [Leptolyngbyaceae cyanobacterium bins.302]